MALITVPDLPLAGIEWSLDRPAQINVALTGKRAMESGPLYGKWRARVEIAARSSESEFRALRSFLVRCQGAVSTFRLPATVEAQNSNSGVTVASTVAAGATAMNLSGTSTPLLAGQMVTVNDQLLVLTDDQLGSSISFEPPLRAQASSGTSVETANPTALVHMSAPQVSYSIAPWRRFSSTFSVEEAF